MKLGILIEWNRINSIEKLMAGLPEMTEEEQTDQVERLMGKARFEGYVVVNGEKYEACSPLFSVTSKDQETIALHALSDLFIDAIDSKIKSL